MSNAQNTAQINTALPRASDFNRMEGFVKHFQPHKEGNGGTLFLNTSRSDNNNHKTYHTAMISVFGDNARFSQDISNFLKAEKNCGRKAHVFLSVNTQWQSFERGTGKMKGEYEIKRLENSFFGKDILEVNASTRMVINSAEAYCAKQKEQTT
jgi:hypothetical protein